MTEAPTRESLQISHREQLLPGCGGLDEERALFLQHFSSTFRSTSASATYALDYGGRAETKKKGEKNPTQEQTNSPVPPHTVWTYLSSKEQYRRKRRTPSLCDAREKPNLLALSRKYRTHRVGHGLLKRTEQSLVPVNKVPKKGGYAPSKEETLTQTVLTAFTF